MRSQYRKIFIVLVLLLPLVSIAQKNGYKALTIGDNIKGQPAFENVVNSENSRLSFDKLLGKLIIIDFWSTGCPSCIASIPHLEKLQEEFKDKIQIILVDPWETKEKIEQRVAKLKILRPRIGLTWLPNAYGDTKWRFIFPHSSLPHHIWIDPKGIVIASSGAINTTREHIMEVLAGNRLNISIKDDLLARGYDVRKAGIMRPGDSSIQPIIYSSIIKANHGFSAGSQMIEDSIKQTFKKNIYNESLLTLCQIACHGFHVSLEVKNTTPFFRPKNPNDFDSWFEGNCFSYEIALPLRLSDSIYTYMRSDISRFLAANKNLLLIKQKRIYPAYVLRKVNNQVLNNSLDKSKSDDKLLAMSLKRLDNTFENVRIYLKQNIEDLSLKIPVAFVDETHITDAQSASIYLPVDFSDKAKLQSILQSQGLELSLENREMEIYIIKDMTETASINKGAR